MNDPLTEAYFRWLGPQIGDANSRYEDLLRLLFIKEFVWLIPNDDNRAADGLDLRVEFCAQQNVSPDSLKNIRPTSFLEVLIGLSRRLAFGAGGQAQGWAWQLLNNLELHKYPDPLSRKKEQRVDDILDGCIWRTYQSDGQGGFFPLAWPNEDQTKVELWYQMAAYINELQPEQ